MNERTTEVLEQYELEVQSKRRGRGAWICETSQGLKLLREYKGTVKRLEFEEQIMNVLQNQKTCRTDQYMRNREGGGGGWNAVCCEGMVFRARVQCAERGGGGPGGRADREAAPDTARHCDR